MIKHLPIDNFKCARISSPYGKRVHPIYKTYTMHYGIDYPSSRGTKVYAVADGKVVISKMQTNKKGFGNYIVILHDNQIYSLYAHLDKRVVEAGTTVSKGKYIGTVGSTGDSTGNHLHFGMCTDYKQATPNASKWFDPTPYLAECEEETSKVVKTIKVKCGKVVQVSVINKNNENYIRMRDLDEKLRIAKIGYDKANKLPTINGKIVQVSEVSEVSKVSVINKNGENYIRMRDLDEKLGIATVGYDSANKMPIIERK